MSDNKDKKKKGFFARLFGSSDAPKDSNNKDTSSKEINETPTLSAVKKMKKADIVDSAKLGAHIATIPPKILESMYNHPLTNKGLNAFLEDWEKTGQSIL